ncbi:uncharacterized protein LOC100569853 [Acyrthosiphon pisum]|uniref:Uncharacterized protein n=1 Tax=Acyrthosiphon pisum TaxID=7029 RepID=A0A8R1W766_ACYPI|nr:uncharacterized protein LOC100569853 [Acyrthosiphon pisum]|eukprot:XP_003247824.1 PREDICTED: uncharacterized protein LOC100569853 [Acyrthosiphon pisum]
MWCVRVQTSRSTIIKPTNMIIQSIFIQITFWWLLSTTIDCVLVEQASEKRISAESVPLPDIPMVREESVHMLTAVRFPPPALFFANPVKKWSLGDFEKPDLVATYSVTDDVADMQDEKDAYLQQDPAMTTEPETEAEAEATTIVAEVYESVNGLQQTTGDRHVESLKPAGDGIVESLQPNVDEHVESLQPISDALTESLQPTHDRLVDSQSTTTSRLVVTPKQQSPPMRVVNQLPADSSSEKRWTASRNRPRRPVASEHGRPPTQKIVLTSRPLPVPDADVRFPDVEYAVARLGERKILRNFRRQ